MAKKINLPGWVSESRAHLSRIIPKIHIIRREGQAEIKQGLEKVSEADRLQREAEYLNRIVSQDLPPEYWNDEIVMVSGTYLANRLYRFDHALDDLSSHVVAAGEAGKKSHGYFVRAVSDSDGSSGSALYLGAGIEQRMQAIQPTYVPILVTSQLDRVASRDELLRN